MDHIYRGDRLVTTAGVAERDGRFFLAQRKRGGAQSMRWEFPGGKCDQADGSEASCLKREFREEFGVTIDVGREIGSIPFEHGQIRYMLVGYEISFRSDPTTLHEHLASGWFTVPEMLDLDLADSDRTLIEYALAP